MAEEHLNGNWLDRYDYKLPRSGEVRKGILLEIDENGAIINVGLKHNGFVPRDDLERLEKDLLARLQPGQEIKTQIVRATDQEGGLLLSLSYVQEEEDWIKAKEMLAQEETWHGQVVDFNRGGLLIKFGHLTGFVPASHLHRWDNSLQTANDRKNRLKTYVGQELALKIIEANQDEDRLIMSERLARVQIKEENQEALMEQFSKGQVVHGVVRNIVDFGVFVALGDIDGLIHISELSWRRVHHPNEVVQIGDELDVYILNVDRKNQRISLSLKQLKPNPWAQVEQTYRVGQIVTGTVTNVVNFGAFVALDVGVEGLLHASEIASPEPDNPREFLEQGERLTVEILEIDAGRQRVGLSLKRVTERKESNALEFEPEA